MDNKRNPMQTKSGNNITVPLIAAVAITSALIFGWMMTSNGDRNQAEMTTQSSSTGASSGEAGPSTIRNDQDMRANPGAGAAPTKAPNSNPAAADTQAIHDGNLRPIRGASPHSGTLIVLGT